ncbi:MAG: hypothetical protein PHI23_02575, partial [Candidatus Peribacteraceae bacterium]|nr:hypothetical protein [Candidatus Peribacteraceae bacterium]
RRVQEMESASRAVPQAVFVAIVKTIGHLITVLTALSLVVAFALGNTTAGWWVMPVILLLYGLLLLWCTKSDVGEGSFQSVSVLHLAKPSLHTARKPMKVRLFGGLRKRRK